MKKILIIIFLFLISIYAVAQDEVEENETELETPNEIKLWMEDSLIIYNMIPVLRQYKCESNDTTLQSKSKIELLNKKLVKINKKYKETVLRLHLVAVQDVEEEKKLNLLGLEKIFTTTNNFHKKLTGKVIATNKEIKKMFKKIKKGKTKTKLTNREKIIGQKIMKYYNNPLYKLTLAMSIPDNEKYYDKTGKYIIKCRIPIPELESEDNSSEVKYKDSSYSHGIYIGEKQDAYNDILTIEVKIIKKIENRSKAMKIKKGMFMPLHGVIESINYNGKNTELIEIIIK